MCGRRSPASSRRACSPKAVIVKAGQPLYQIDPGALSGGLDNANGQLAQAKAKADARLDLKRDQALVAQNAIAPQDADDAKAAYRFRRRRRNRPANVETARINLDYTRITAPITGRIGASAVTEGALVTANQTTALATISTLDPIYVDINQSSSELLALEHAGPARPGRSQCATGARSDAEAGRRQHLSARTASCNSPT